MVNPFISICIVAKMLTTFFIKAVLAGNETFLTENITQDRKRFITQSKHMTF